MVFRLGIKWRVVFLFRAAFALFVILISPRTPAQVVASSLSGKITAVSGSPIANAHITIKNTGNGDTKATIANEDGSFTIGNLSPGTYEITVSAPGFAEAKDTVIIGVGTNQVANTVLQPQVSNAAGKGQGGTSGVSGTVSSKNVSDLPLNGRSASDLATLEPGVTSARTQASGQAQRGFGNQMTISGGRPRQNDSRLDGISVNDYVNGPPGSALGVNLGADAVEQFSVLTSNYPALYGRSSGGIIAASTRSGTNNFHGNVFEYLRNSSFDARNFFDAAKPPFRRNQFGGSVGGPISKGKTFFFVAYEGLRQSQGITQVDTTPSQAARSGQLCAPPDCSTTTKVAVNAQITRFLDAFYPLPNGALLCPFSSCVAGTGDTGIFTFAGQQVTPENYFTTKVDHRFSEKDLFYGTYMFDAGKVRQPDELNDKRTGYDSRRQVFTAHEAHILSPSLFNAFRFGVSRVVAVTGLTFPSGNALVADSSFSTVPGLNAAAIGVPGLTFFSGGLGTRSNYHFHWTSLQGYDDVALTKGTHAIKFGFGLERVRDNVLAVSDTGGEFSFNSLFNFLTNSPFSLSVAIPGAISERGFRQTIVGAYVQDDWRWRPNLTINLGMRYETATVPTEVHGKLTALRELTDAQPHLGDPLISNPTLRNFEPRVGFSWDPFADAKTVLSSGFGMFDVLPLPYTVMFNELFSAPFFKLGVATALPPDSFPTGAFDIAASSNIFRQGFFDSSPRRNYVMQWNLTLAQDLTQNISMRVGYVGSRGVHQPFRVEDADIVLPSLTPQGYVWPSPPGSGSRLNSNAGRITAAFWQGNSFYDALQLKVKAKIGSGGEIGGSYTWGKTIDTSSGSLVGDEYSNSISSPLWFNMKLNRGLADFNVAHNLEVNYTFELSTPKWAHAVNAWALGGWQVGGVFEASTGVPFTPGFAGDALGVKSIDPNIDVPNLVSAPGCGALVNPGDPNHYIKTQCFAVPNPITLRGNLGRNTLVGPGLINLDSSLLKNNHIKRISDNFNVQFRAEFFNLLNHTNFVPPLDNRNIFDSTGNAIGNAGLITSTQTPSRQIQFALKAIW